VTSLSPTVFLLKEIPGAELDPPTAAARDFGHRPQLRPAGRGQEARPANLETWRRGLARPPVVENRDVRPGLAFLQARSPVPGGPRLHVEELLGAFAHDVLVSTGGGCHYNEFTPENEHRRELRDARPTSVQSSRGGIRPGQHSPEAVPSDRVRRHTENARPGAARAFVTRLSEAFRPTYPCRCGYTRPAQARVPDLFDRLAPVPHPAVLAPDLIDRTATPGSRNGRG
jgi:hypothetical protein